MHQLHHVYLEYLGNFVRHLILKEQQIHLLPSLTKTTTTEQGRKVTTMRNKMLLVVLMLGFGQVALGRRNSSQKQREGKVCENDSEII